MEIEDLKTAFERRAVIDAASALATVPTKFVIQQNSVSGMNKALRSVKWETGFSITFGLLCLFGFFQSETIGVKAFLLFICFYSFVFSIYLLLLQRKLHRHLASLKSVKDCIADTITLLSQFMKLYERAATAFVPGIFIAAFLASFINVWLQDGEAAEIPYLTIVVSVPVLAGWIFLMRKFTRWYLNRLYGHQLHLLQQNLLELSHD